MRLTARWDLRSASERFQRAPALHPAFDPLEKARLYLDTLQRQPGLSYGDVAGRYGVTRTEVCHYITVARRLAPELLAMVEAAPVEKRPSLRSLLKAARLPSPKAQRLALSGWAAALGTRGRHV